MLDDLDAIPSELRGQHPRNPVNRPAEQGVQIELPPSIRWNVREWGWSDHEGVSRTRDVERLIDSLSEAVTSWQPDLSAGARPAAASAGRAPR